MSNRPIVLYLTDIKEAIDKIETYVRRMTFSDFEEDSKTVDAVVRNIDFTPGKVSLSLHLPYTSLFQTGVI